MAYRFTGDDVRFLTSDAAAPILAAAIDLPLTDRTLIADLSGLRRGAGGAEPHVAAVVETVLLRRRAVERWGALGFDWTTWLFTDEALQQAPPPPVAAHRARRIARHVSERGAGGQRGSEYDVVHDVTCSIGVDLAALSVEAPIAIGSDLDPVRLAMARHNLAASGLPARLMRADARTITARSAGPGAGPGAGGVLRYADPARRDLTGRRISSADTIPPVAELDAADPAHPPILRLPPAMDFRTLGRAGEIEIVSWRGIVREAVSWPPELARVGRRATVLGDDAVREELTDEDPADDTVIPAGTYLIDPDPAIVRAHLITRYAARHGLHLMDPHLAYLTGDVPPPGVRSFEILDAAPFSEKVVRGWTRRDRVGTLEIKQRGTSVIPDELRRRIKPPGDRRTARTLVVARVGTAPRAYWCRPVPGDRPGAGRQ